ncbi:hypothetical protein LguiA_004732 [Lonicera macranthoides]
MVELWRWEGAWNHGGGRWRRWKNVEWRWKNVEWRWKAEEMEEHGGEVGGGGVWRMVTVEDGRRMEMVGLRYRERWGEM